MGNQISQNNKPISPLSKVIDYIVGKYKLKVLLTGDEGEKKFSEEILKNFLTT